MQTGPSRPARRRPVAGPRTLGLLICLGGLWGLHIVFAKAIGVETAREALAMLVVYVSVVAVAAVRSGPFRPTGRTLRFFLISTALGYMGPIFCELMIAPRIDAGLFALIAGATPLATVGIAVAIGRDRLSRALALALAAGSGAALLLFGPAALQAGPGAPSGWVALAFLVPLLYGAGDVYIEAGWPEGLSVHQVAAAESVMATGWAAVLAALFGLGPSEIAGVAVAAGWPAIGLIATALVATWAYFAVIERAGAIFVSFASYVTIATGVLAGIALFGERPGAALAGAAALTALALWLLNRDRARAGTGHPAHAAPEGR